MAEKRMPAAERQREDTAGRPAPLQGGGRDNRPDTGHGAGPERELTRARWAFEG
jgi:hypothetical protein